LLIYYFLFVFPVIAILSAAVYAPFALAVRGKGRDKWYHLARFAFVGCVLSLFYLTIMWYYPNISFHPEYYFLNLQPFVWITECYTMGVRRMLQQLAMNIVMFVPYGLLLPIVFRRMRGWWKTGLTALASTVLIETTQYFIGRSADIDDVIMNLAGGLLGYGLFFLLNRVLKTTPRWQSMLG